MAEEIQQFTVIADEKDKKSRLDKCLARHITSISRSFIQKLIEEGYVCINDEIVVTQPSHKVKVEDSINLVIPPPIATEMIAANIPLDIVFEDDYFLVINKAAGMTVHPGAGHYQDTLANALLYHCKEGLSGIGGVERPGIVHRLDKDTSGLMLAAKTDAAHRVLSENIASRAVKRTYLAFCWGVPKLQEGTIDANIGRHQQNRQKMVVLQGGGKKAVTHYRIIESYGRIASLVECRLETGRTHQIRVHMAHIGNSLIGDPVYGRQPGKLPSDIGDFMKGFKRQALHSHKLGLDHPVLGNPLEFQLELPDDMKGLNNVLKI